MKGVATTATTLMILIVFVIFFGVYFYMANNSVRNNVQLNLESVNIVKLKSTFLLFNQSIGTTWLISTAQAIFQAGDESIGCGGQIGLPGGYWYKLNPTQARDLTDRL